MGLLVLGRRDMALRLDGQAAAVYEGVRRAGSVPLKLVDQLVVQGSGIVPEASVLGRVAEQGVIAVLNVVENQRFESRLVRRLIGHAGFLEALVLFAIGEPSSSEV